MKLSAGAQEREGIPAQQRKIALALARSSARTLHFLDSGPLVSHVCLEPSPGCFLSFRIALGLSLLMAFGVRCEEQGPLRFSW